MTEVKFSEILRCSSEDPHFPSSNLLKTTTEKWVCAKNNPEPSSEVEILLSKAVVISFIDIGNHGTHFVDVLVKHSLRNNEFVSIIPTFTFMSVSESKQGANRCKVEMFKKENMMADVRDEKWDVLKVVCRQPYNTTSQYGLSFIKVKGTSLSASTNNNTAAKSPSANRNQIALQSFFGFNNNNNIASSPKAPKLNLKPNLAKSPRTPVLNNAVANSFKTPSPKRSTMLPAEQEKFVTDVEEFLNEIKFVESTRNSTVKVSEIRQQYESKRGESLRKQEKKLFMMVISEIVAKSQLESAEEPTSTPFEVPDAGVKCNKCNVLIPHNVISIHEKVCAIVNNIETTTKKRQNRKSICFDGAVDDDDTPSKRKRFAVTSTTSVSPTSNNLSPVTPNALKVKRSGSYALDSGRASSSSIRKRSGSYKASGGSASSIDDLEIETAGPPLSLSASVQEATKKLAWIGKSSKSPGQKKDPKRPMKQSSSQMAHNQSHTTTKHTPDSTAKQGSADVTKKVNSMNSSRQILTNLNQTTKKQTSDMTMKQDSISVTREVYPMNNFPGAKEDLLKQKKPVYSVGLVNNIYTKNNMESATNSSWMGGKHEKTASTPMMNFVECPMCFQMIDGLSITVHAASCEGEETNTEESATHGGTQKCPICFEQISVYRIGLHAMTCTGKKVAAVHTIEDDEELPTVFASSTQTTSWKPRSLNSESEFMKNNVTVDESFGKTNMTTCPVCSDEVENFMIDIHVNMCLDRQ